MNRLQLPPPADARNRVSTRATDADYDMLIDEPTALYVGDRLFAVLGHLEHDNSVLAGALQRVPRHDDIRTGAMMTRSRTFGYSPRVVVRRKEACHGFALNREHPAVFGQLCALASEATELYREHAPLDVWNRHVAAMAPVHDAWRLAGTLFTSGIVNFDSPLALHRDAGNFPGTWNVQVVFRRDVEGGHLVLPGARIAFDTFDHSYLLMDAQATVHGVSPITKRKRDGYRTSVVFYSLRQLCQCGSPEQEVAHAKRMRTEREQRRAGLIA